MTSRQSGGLSDRNVEGLAKDQAGTLKGFNHAQKLRDSLQGAINRLNAATKAGFNDLAARAAATYTTPLRD